MTDPVAVEGHSGAKVEIDRVALTARLFHEHGDRLVGLAAVLLRERGAAEEVVQEAFLRLQRHTPSLDSPGSEAAYLRSIVLNLARSRLRRRRLAAAKRVLPLAARAGPEEIVELRDEQRRVVEAVRQLPTRQRECLVLRYYDDLSDGEIAETLRLSITSVRTHLRRGKASLAQDLDPRSGRTS